MSEKQAKLLRYFVKLTGDTKLAEMTRKAWPHMTAKRKGKATKWLRHVCAFMQALKSEQEKRQAQAKIAQAARNLEMLRGFAR